MKNKIWFFALTLFVLVLGIGNVLADSWNTTEQPSITQMTVSIEGNDVFTGSCVKDSVLTFWNCNTDQLETPAFERSQDVSVKVTFIAGEDLENLEIKAWISGYSEDIESVTSKFDVFEGNMYTRTLTLNLPEDLDAKDEYTLHVEFLQKSSLSGIESAEINTLVQKLSDQLKILSVDLFGYYGEVYSGNTLYADVVVKNFGNHQVEDVFVKASIKELGISRNVYVGDIASEDDCSNDCDEEDAQVARLILTIPQDAVSGTYLLEIEVEGDNIVDKVVKPIYIERITNPLTPSNPSYGGLELSAFTTMNEVEAGEGTAFTVTVSNTGSSAMIVSLSALGIDDWASAQINPSVITLSPGESKTATVYLVVKNSDVEGEHIFTVKASSGTISKQMNLTVDVKESRSMSLQTILMIVGAILGLAIVVLLIVLLTKRNSAKVEENYY